MMNMIDRFKFGKNKKKCIILKWDKDIRQNENKNVIKSHDGIESTCFRIKNKLCYGNDVRTNIFNIVNDYDVIGIDEGHFFTIPNDIVNFCEIMCNQYGKIVIVTALDGDYKRNPFDEVMKLIPKCEIVIKLNAKCTICSKDAYFSHKSIQSNELIDIGGSEKYTVLCRFCYLQLNMKII